MSRSRRTNHGSVRSGRPRANSIATARRGRSPRREQSGLLPSADAEHRAKLRIQDTGGWDHAYRGIQDQSVERFVRPDGAGRKPRHGERRRVSALLRPATLQTPAGSPGRLAARCRRSLPPLAATLVGTAGWTLAMVASAVLTMSMRGWEMPDKLEKVAILYGFGAAIAFPVAFFLARLVSRGRSAEAAFAAMFVALALCTIGATAGLFALDYRSYYAEWHEEFGTVTWAFQFFFTAANAVIQFAVLGMRLFFPLGFVALFVVSLWFARRAR